MRTSQIIHVYFQNALFLNKHKFVTERELSFNFILFNDLLIKEKSLKIFVLIPCKIYQKKRWNYEIDRKFAYYENFLQSYYLLYVLTVYFESNPFKYMLF